MNNYKNFLIPEFLLSKLSQKHFFDEIKNNFGHDPDSHFLIVQVSLKWIFYI